MQILSLINQLNLCDKILKNCVRVSRQDELLWAASWLHRATDDKTYLDNLGQAGNTGGARTVFAWDDKFIGVQVLVAKVLDQLCVCIAVNLFII